MRSGFNVTTFIGVISISLKVITQLQATVTVHSFTISSSLPKSTSNYGIKQSRIFANLYSENANSATPTLSTLPKGISPFEKSLSKNIDIQADFRYRAKAAVDAAMSSDPRALQLLEIEFPPLLGGYSSKSQFDDFDNIEELESNKNWAIQFAPLFLTEDRSPFANGKTWLIFPDLKECELGRKEWPGKRYQEATFTTLQAATQFLTSVKDDVNGGKDGDDGGYNAPWGAAIAEGFNKILGSSSSNSDDSDDDSSSKKDAGLLGDITCLDPLIQGQNSPSTFNVIVQPGNGGPVEDWINVETIHSALSSLLSSGEDANDGNSSVLLIVNGALDKVRDGYYPAFFFPNLAKTVDRFYRKFETVFYLKPITDKGLYGWLYRVYPEPWQVILQTVKKSRNGDSYVEDTVVYKSEERPTYALAISKMIEGVAAE